MPLACRLLPVVLAISLPATAASQTVSAAAAREDYDVLWKSIREAHGGLHRYVSASELDGRVASHRARLDRELSQLEFAGILSESLVELRDGHTRLEYDSATMAAIASSPMLPLRVALEGERLVIAFNDSPDTTLRPGMEVVSINGKAARDLLQVFLKRVSGDGFIETGKRARAARQFPTLYWLHIEPAQSFDVVARDGDRTVRARLPGVIERERARVVNPVNADVISNMARLDAPPGNVALEYIGGGSVARLRVRAFDGQGFPATLDSAFRVVRERGTKSLVLDLRGNGGGVDEYGSLLVSYFVDRPFRYFDHIHVPTIAPSFATWLPRTFEEMRTGTVPHPSGGFRLTSERHSGVAEQKPGSNPFLGKVVVLIDGGTFSTAADVAAQLRSMNRATFLGEETAGAYEGNTSGLNALIVLPHSKLRLRIMMYDYWNAVRPPAERGRGTIPDQVARRTVADLIRGVDPVLDAAIGILR